MSSQDESNQEPVAPPEGWPDGESPLRTEPVAVADEGMLIVDVGGFEGPLDLLLELARQHKVDLKHISILKLAEQYLEFIERARKLQLEIAADYLVMAAWLAYLKSRLLIPVPPGSEEQEPADLAARLAFRLQRLQARPRLPVELGGPRLEQPLPQLALPQRVTW